MTTTQDQPGERVKWIPTLLLNIEGKVHEQRWPAMESYKEASAFAQELFDADPTAEEMRIRRLAY